MEITEDFKKYLAGFFDGDGCILINKQKNGFTLRIRFFQSNEDWINTINRYYPFLHKSGGCRRDNHRNEYSLGASGIQIKPLINDLLKYSILKYEQLLLANKYFDLINAVNKTDEKNDIYEKLKSLKKNSTNKPYERSSIQYIAGLFDAEGSIGIYNNTLRVKITQKSDIKILEDIAIKYNNRNKIDNYAISFYGINSLQILNDIKEYCIYKTPQINAAIKYIDTIGKELTESVLNLRKECKNIITNEKHVDVNMNDKINQESHKKYLIDAFTNFKTFSYNEMLSYCKMKEIQEIKTVEKFENKIYNALSVKDWKTFNISPVLEFCETNHQLQLYNYYRKKVSSLPCTGVIGRSIKILVKDSIINKYIGIMCLSSDVYNLGERDNYIKKTSGIIDFDKNKDSLLKSIMNISCCVPLQPFGFNTNGGKLLASLAFSKEIFDYYYNKYKEPLLAIITTSINGKSIQYDRLKCLKMIGYTKGFGSVNIPQELYLQCKEYNNIWKVVEKSDRIDRYNFLKKLLQHLQLSQNILLHNNKRGIYFGYLFSSKFNENYNCNELLSINDIYTNWKNRWCNNRIDNLIKQKRIKKSFDLYTNEFFKNIKCFNLPKVQNEVTYTLNDNLIKDILMYKNKSISKIDVSNIFNKKLNGMMNLNEDDILKIYIGEILPKNQDSEYKQLMSQKVSKKLTDQEIYFILDLHKNKIDDISLSYTKIMDTFKMKYNKDVSKFTISKILNGEKEPLVKKTVKQNENKFKDLSDDQIKLIIQMKNKNTSQEVSDYIKKNFNVYINRTFISKLWKCEKECKEIVLTESVLNSNEYKEMCLLDNKKIIKRKFTKEEIEWIKINNMNKSLNERVLLFKNNFNKTMTKQYLSELIKSQVF